MSRLFYLLLILPWWAYFPLAGGAVYLGQIVYEKALEDEAAKRAAFEAGPPPAVDLGAYTSEAQNESGELSIRFSINTDYNYTLTRSANGVRTSEEYLYMLFDPSDEPDARWVRGAIVVDAADKEKLLAKFADQGADPNDPAPIIELGGMIDDFEPSHEQVMGAMADLGLSPMAEFFYFEPFLEPRAAELAPSNRPEEQRKYSWILAAMIALFGAGKRLYYQDRRNPDEPVIPLENVGKYTPDFSAGADKAMLAREHVFQGKRQEVQLSGDIDPDSPLGRIALGGAAPAQADTTVGEAEPEDIVDPEYEAALQVAMMRQKSLGRLIRQSMFGLVAILLLALFATVFLAKIDHVDEATLMTLLAAIAIGLYLPIAVVLLLLRFSKAHEAARAAGLTMAAVRQRVRNKTAYGLTSEALVSQDVQDVPTMQAEKTPVAATLSANVPMVVEPELDPLHATNDHESHDNAKPKRKLGAGPITLIVIGAAIAALYRFDAQLAMSLVPFVVMLGPIILLYMAARWLKSRMTKPKKAQVPNMSVAASKLTDAAEDTLDAPAPKEKRKRRARKKSAPITDALQEGKAWVEQKARAAVPVTNNFSVDPRERMRADPFAKLAEQVRAER